MTNAVTPLKLRDYQAEAIDAVADEWLRIKRTAVILPTGAGKTVVFAHMDERPDVRERGKMLVLAHRDELVGAAVEKLRTVNPRRHVGVIDADNKNFGASAIVASVATLRSPKNLVHLRGVGTIVVDECHHATAPSYRRIIEHFGGFDPMHPLRVVGFTATMSRSDRAALGDVWQSVAYSKDIASMIRDGYLCGVRGVRVYVPRLDLDKVKRARGDYADAALGEALEGSLAPELVAKAYRAHAADKQGILFAPTVATAYVFAKELEAEGFAVAVVHGETPKTERRAALADFRAGRVQILANCMVLTEGTDLPMAEVCVVARPTQSSALYIQMVGRVLRPYPGKVKALVLDVVGASQTHALVSPVQLFGEQAPPIERDEEVLDDVEGDEWDDVEKADPVPRDGPVFLSGEIASTEVDMFHNSASAWLRTYAGIWFLPAGERVIAIFPAMTPGLYDVMWLTAKAAHGTPGASGWVARDCADLSYAMAYAEGNVTSAEQLTAARERDWRARKASDAQIGFGRRYGLSLHKGMTSGEAGSLLSVAIASLRIDPHLPAHIRRG